MEPFLDSFWTLSSSAIFFAIADFRASATETVMGETKMDPRETYIFTHYSHIADARRGDVRSLQAEVARGIALWMCNAVRRVFRRIGQRPCTGQGDLS